MSRLMLTSDLHLGHKNILEFRSGFESQEEHDETIFENLATSLNKRDSIIFLGDIAFDAKWLRRIGDIKCAKKTLILGNHDLERGISMRDLTGTYDRIESLMSRRNVYFSHCPIHPQQFRGRTNNIHGHMHDKHILTKDEKANENLWQAAPDERYINVCVEQTNWKPVAFSDLINKTNKGE